MIALIGATGVGKTTTAAKLAAQCVRQYGAGSVGLITLDTYRVAGYEQLRSYGRMLGVVAHLAHDRAALKDLLTLLASRLRSRIQRHPWLGPWLQKLAGVVLVGFGLRLIFQK